ncbi:MAG: TetR/AcrR family transcriptional regulator [Bacillota bacterium]
MDKISRRERKKAKTREAIYKAALELFIEKGYNETTIEDITEKVDVAKGTFFNYFPTKEAVLFYMNEQRVALLEEMLKKELKDVKSSEEKLYGCLKLFGRINEDEKELTALVLMETSSKMMSKMAPDVLAQIRWKSVLVNVLEEGKHQGEFRHDFNSDHAADLIISMYFFTLVLWLEGRCKNSLTDELLARVEIIMAGIKL